MSFEDTKDTKDMSVSSGASSSLKTLEDDALSTNGSSVTDYDSSEKIKRDLSRQESLTVLLLRVLVILILVLSAMGICILVYSISHRSDEDEVLTQLGSAANQLRHEFEAIGTEKLSALGSLAVTATVQGVDQSRGFPYVSLSSFQERGYMTLANAGVLSLSINPLVSDEQRGEWEAYVIGEDSKWIQEAIDYQATLGSDQFIVNYGEDFTGAESYSIKQSVELGQGPVDMPHGPSQYLPQWQMSPLISRDVINLDTFEFDHYDGDAAKRCLETGSVVLGGPDLLPPGQIDEGNNSGFYAQLLSVKAGKEVPYRGDPLTSIYIPIFSSVHSDNTTVGVLHAVFDWASYFKNILPGNIFGVDVVLHSQCHESYTFRINGRDVEPLGNGVSSARR